LDANVYFSSNKGTTWYVLPATNALSLADSASFQYATTSCAGLNLYKAAGAATYSKAINIYGGSVWLTDGSIVEAVHGLTSLPTTVTSYSYVPYPSTYITTSSTGGAAPPATSSSAAITTVTTATSAVTISTAATSAPAPSGSSSSSLSGGAIAGIVIGSVVGALLILSMLICACLTVGKKGSGGKSSKLEESGTHNVDTSRNGDIEMVSAEP